MGQSLYPTFNLPAVVADNERPKKRSYKQSFFFDYEVGDFLRDGANRFVLAEGREAFCQWCLKQCATERGTKLAYSDKIGVEIVRAAKEENDIAAVESAIQRTITEALMVNPETEYVKNFQFSWNGADRLQVSFVVKGHEWDEDTLTVTY